MEFSYPIISLLLHFLLIVSLVCPINSSKIGNQQLTNQTFRSKEEFHKWKKMITSHLKRINKHAVKTIQSPDGDIIDCVLIHKQPAFDHPLLKGQKPLDPPKRPRENNQIGNLSEIIQLWSLSGESCPDGTIPIRRTTEQDLLRAGSISRFGRKYIDRDNYEHAMATVQGDGYTGATAYLNVWRPKVETKDEFSSAKISLSSQTSGDIIEAGWQVYNNLYGDNLPRMYIFWTADVERQNGCYDLKCSGFVQTNKKFAIGGAVSPFSTYNRSQYDFQLTIWKEPNNGNWWLEYGDGTYVGYWPSSLFTQLKDEAYFAQFGGEVFNLKTYGSHTSTQMGSGHFESEGFGKAAFMRKMQVAVTSHSVYIDLPDPDFSAEKPNCYNVKGGFNKDLGYYMYYGGPGKNKNCP